MVVEFIGSTGSGKTTMLRGVERRLEASAGAITASDLVTGLVSLRRVTHTTAQNLIEEIVGFPFFVSSLYKHRAFVAFTISMLLRQRSPAVTTISNLRSLERKLGVYALIRRIATDRIVLVDEGPVLAAHMFVHSLDRLIGHEIAAFAQTLPLPDVIVYVRAPVEAIVARTLLRPDPPRNISLCRRSEIVRYAEAAVALFDELAAVLTGVLPILCIDNPDTDENRQKLTVETIASFIINQHLKAACSPAAALIGSAT